jgi:hypothetical protein
MERAMGIEPRSRVPQVIEFTHLTSPIGAQNLAYLVHRITLRIVNDVAINSQHDSRIRMSHLRFDRFARSVSHLLRALETFKALGIDFVSFAEQMDTSTPAGKMVFTVLSAVAELERSLIVERVRAGMRNARAKGKRIGRPPRTYLNQDARRSISEAYAMGGASLRQLAVRFGTSIGTVQRCIQLYQRAST